MDDGKQAKDDHALMRLLTSTITLKIVMAATGAAMIGFVVVHMVGHLQMFLGRDRYNEYAHFMQSLGELLWLARLGLLSMVAAHIGAAVVLSQRNITARPREYLVKKHRAANASSLTMRHTGMVLLLFIAYHVLHFTVGAIHPEHFSDVDPHGRKDVYNNFVLCFQNPGITLVYLAAMTALCFHLAHSVTSMFKTLSIAEGRFRAPAEAFGPLLAGALFVGFIAPPLACQLGFLHPVYEGSEHAGTRAAAVHGETTTPGPKAAKPKPKKPAVKPKQTHTVESAQPEGEHSAPSAPAHD